MGQISQQELESQTSLLARGCEAIYTAQELRARLEQAAAEGRQLRIKLGLDPTAPDIHLGHTVVLRKMRQFQDLGHRAVLIIGDYTARVGDPSGQDKTRPVLSEDEISTNAETYFQQAGKVLDTSPEKLEIRRNSEWLQTLGSADVLRLSAQMTVAQMLERDTFEKRYKAGVPIGVHEFLYPILQGYDSVMIRADVELGGSDQTFNNLVGRDLQRSDGQPPQIVVIMPILVGLDGVEKMSKSKGNYIGVTDTPGEMFGKVMSIPDTLMDNYFTLLTDLPREQIDTWVNPDRTHPRDAKVQLGRTVVAQYHGKQAAEAAAEEIDRVFARKQTPTDMPEVRVAGGAINIVQLVVSAGFAKSTSEARRLVGQKAVSIDEQPVTEIDAEVAPTTGQVLRVGKRRFGRIVLP